MEPCADHDQRQLCAARAPSSSARASRPCAIANKVRQWKPLVSATTYGRRVAARAILTAFSIILHVFWEVTREILHHLLDGVEPEDVDAARKAALSVPGVQPGTYRGRWMGRSLTLEIEG